MIPHTVPNRPMKGAAEPIMARPALHLGQLAIGLRAAGFGDRKALPVAHGGGEHASERMLGVAPMAAGQFVQGRARPEFALEFLGFGVLGVELHRLFNGDGPGPDRHEYKDRHHQLHDDIGAHEQIDDGQFLTGTGQIHSDAFHDDQSQPFWTRRCGANSKFPRREV